MMLRQRKTSTVSRNCILSLLVVILTRLLVRRRNDLLCVESNGRCSLTHYGSVRYSLSRLLVSFLADLIPLVVCLRVSVGDSLHCLPQAPHVESISAGL